jgi:hypothetical protein
VAEDLVTDVWIIELEDKRRGVVGDSISLRVADRDRRPDPIPRQPSSALASARSR